MRDRIKNVRKKNCSHRRKKKNYPFGKKSDPIVFCKDCGAVIHRHDLIEKRRKRKP